MFSFTIKILWPLYFIDLKACYIKVYYSTSPSGNHFNLLDYSDHPFTAGKHCVMRKKKGRCDNNSNSTVNLLQVRLYF